MARRSALFLIIAVCLLVFLGLTMLASTSYFAEEFGGDEYLALRKQITGLVVAVCFCAGFALFDYNLLLRVRWLFYSAAVIALGLIFYPGLGVEVNGAWRWIGVGPWRFQPSEFAKIALAVTAAAWFANHEEKTKSFVRGFVLPALLVALPVFLIGVEVDIGNALIATMIGGGIMFVAGTRVVYLMLAVPAAGAALTAAIIYVSNRVDRILAVYDLEKYKDSWGLQQWVSMLAIGSGGVSGQGIGASRMKLHYLPEAHTDFIFPIIGEEFGLIGTAGSVLLYLIIVICGMCIATYAPNRFGKLLGFGLTLMLGLEALLNMGVTTALLPNKGLPLPFVSYGSSSLLAAMIAIGMLINIHRQGVHLTRDDLPVISKKDRWTPQL